MAILEQLGPQDSDGLYDSSKVKSPAIEKNTLVQAKNGTPFQLKWPLVVVYTAQTGQSKTDSAGDFSVAFPSKLFNITSVKVDSGNIVYTLTPTAKFAAGKVALFRASSSIGGFVDDAALNTNLYTWVQVS